MNKSQATNDTIRPTAMRAIYAERTVGTAALHNEELGFLGASELAKKAIDTGKSIDELLAEAKK